MGLGEGFDRGLHDKFIYTVGMTEFGCVKRVLTWLAALVSDIIYPGSHCVRLVKCEVQYKRTLSKDLSLRSSLIGQSRVFHYQTRSYK